LAEVGKLEPVKLQGNYDTGQTFLHSVFGYRGIVLFPWLARVYDRDHERDASPDEHDDVDVVDTSSPTITVPSSSSTPPIQTSATTSAATGDTVRDDPPAGIAGFAPGQAGREIKGRTHTYYQVLIDARDCPFITHRAQTESVTFLGNQGENNRNLYAIPGLDYVSHEDILPYR